MSKKPAAQWALRFQAPNNGLLPNTSSEEDQGNVSRSLNYPILAKFSDPVNWQSLIESRKDSIHMYYQDEELKEDENDDAIVKDADYYKKKRSQQRLKRYYRKKKLLVFECPQERIYYEGKENNLDVAEFERSQNNTNTNNSNNSSNNANHTSNSDFRYVLFKFVKNIDENGVEVPEIQVIPVSSMYTLRKTGKVEDRLLSEIEEKYIEEKKILQKQISKYQKIVHSLQRDRESDKKDDEKLDYVEDISETDLFKNALQKAFGHRIAKIKSGKKKSQRVRDEGGIGMGDSEVSADYVQINEAGIDMDELKEFEFCGGDYEKNFADDEENNVIYEQMVLDAATADEISSSWRNDQLAESSDEEEDEEETKEVKSEGTSFSDVNSVRVDRFMLDEVDEAMEQYKQTASANAGPKSKALKRSRDFEGGGGNEEDDFGITNDNEDLVKRNTKKNASLAASDITESKEAVTSTKEKKRARFGDVDEAERKPINLPTPSTPGVTSSKEFELTEEGVRAFITSRGGIIEVKVLSEAFKAKMKAYSKNDKAAGRTRFLDILNRITVNIEDPIRGTCLSLKK